MNTYIPERDDFGLVRYLQGKISGQSDLISQQAMAILALQEAPEEILDLLKKAGIETTVDEIWEKILHV